LVAERRAVGGRADARAVARTAGRPRHRGDSVDDGAERVAHAAAAARTRRDGGDRGLRSAPPLPRALDLPPRLRRTRRRGAISRRTCRADPGRRRVGARRAHGGRAATTRGGGRARVTDTIVFIPAWNEADNLPAVLDGLRV